jgi:hypothetical protein
MVSRVQKMLSAAGLTLLAGVVAAARLLSAQRGHETAQNTKSAGTMQSCSAEAPAYPQLKASLSAMDMTTLCWYSLSGPCCDRSS